MTNREAHQKNLRKGRFSQPGYWYFITTGTRSRLPVFFDPAASRILLDSLKWLNGQGRMELIAAVVMPDHVHFIARLQNTDLSSLMHAFKSYTSNKINELLGREEPLWEPQYYDHAIRTNAELKDCVNYCLDNPVRRGLANCFKEYPHWYCAYEV